MSNNTTSNSRQPLKSLNSNLPPNGTIPSKLKPKETIINKESSRYSFMQPKENTTTSTTKRSTISRVDQNSTLNSNRLRTDRDRSRTTTPATSLNRTTYKPISTSTTSRTRTTSTVVKQTPQDKIDELAKIVYQLQEEMNKTKSKNEMNQQLLQEKEKNMEILCIDKEKIESDVMASRQDLLEKEERVRQLMRAIHELKLNHDTEVENFENQIRRLEDNLQKCQVDLEFCQTQVFNLKKELGNTKSELLNTKNELEDVSKQLESKTKECKEKKGRIEDLEGELDNLKKYVQKLEETKREHEMIRRKLHNAIQELKGNIRVFCRVRPLLGDESNTQKIEDFYEFPESNEGRDIKVYSTKSKTYDGKEKQQKKLDFTFDKVFSPTSTQSQVFDELTHLVQSSLDGYNTCIFTYGQTGSGKTFTMEGAPDGNKKDRGMIQRSIEQIFKSSERLKEIGWEYSFEAYFLEIYNETIRDLLSKSNKEECKIQHNETDTDVTNIKKIKVSSPEQIYKFLEKANKNRSMGRTNMNDRSSRSHTVFTLKIQGTNKVTSAKTKAVLNLIDLAGSEKVSQSGATGSQLTETKNINKSLSCIGDVISALANGEKHIPYRNSKLTFLLQNSLGGNSKTLMFVNISPSASDLSESLTSLRFALKVNACEIGTAKKGGKIDLNNDKY
eukprot:TRINITY_DN5272_c0_g1_i2.p1 TRINITY_DN5272_c0_g1~~TRINITY_DN5272_c0_g1_i2.p1  ORF type:complete len:672 (-),score=205.91 TRINITY_DN5272_c0_g1_i2:52-2067(-)